MPEISVLEHPIAVFMFLILALGVGGAFASEVNDFTNNLATDLGPLLTLFGEGMTKQYLSESTTFVDYLIFAMAPIGIITALVSVIRVCGDRSLRAFIGKAQEADSAIEAELCTSTSRDVCELFNQTGITRTLGSPSLLELVFYPDDAKNNEQHMGIHIFRHYLSTEDCKEWHHTEPVSVAQPTADIEAAGAGNDEKKTQGGAPAGQPESSKATNASPTGREAVPPNLFLNVGVIKLQPWWVFYVVAAIGITLQFGVIVMAGLVSWKAGWEASGESAAFAHNKSALIFIVGTPAMCGGMLSCAALIGEAT
ncbi:hypothetical protein L207DRAFT_121736 [Hyaloscypha variabilis F]|uniref:Uncharacterized protein n=1 Tax=Hyaloscypha variabilis (strain UAMH 11265 / GT02V1 / F) TaxID=1149755 RepID=A0A2J6R7P6_HYAVF|nr:hypothetical protein L207DRAFT_121736 [Hyaloscypha variabilis F]